MIAHIIPSASSLAILAAWGVSSLGLLAGAVLLIADLHRRRLGALVLSLSSAGAVVAALVTPWPPAPPGYSISVVIRHTGDRITSPVAITVCGRTSDGSATAVPGADRVVYMALDGKQVMTVRAASMVVPMTSGKHLLRLEILTGDHRAFQPPLLTDLQITVRGRAAPAFTTSCSR